MALTIPRRFSAPDDLTGDDYGGVAFALRTVAGQEVVVPVGWDQTAAAVLVTKYFRRAGVPLSTQSRAASEHDIPEWLRARVPASGTKYAGETDARQVFHRLAGCWTHWGWRLGYFQTEADARRYMAEMKAVLAKQVWAPNSPQWFNTGLHWAYGITGEDVGQWADAETFPDDQYGRTVLAGVAAPAGRAYYRPAPSACFIIGVADSLLDKGGIYDALTTEARVFKFGGGAGSNFSALRGAGEPLTGGGKSSGVMSFLDVFDAGGGTIKSGGISRRAAKMVVCDADHPDVEQFVSWKAHEEYRAACTAAGDALIRRLVGGGPGHDAPADARDRECVPAGTLRRAALAERYGTAPHWPETPYTTDFDDPRSVYARAGGQNSNNSLRVPDTFMRAAAGGALWPLTRRTDGRVCKTLPARALWDRTVAACWTSGDPGVQFDTVINEWHTCPADGRIRATNPCAEYCFLDDTACNLGSVRLTAFSGRREGEAEPLTFDAAGFHHACRLATITLDITVGMAAYPTEKICQGSIDYRTLGLGYCDLGSMLMRWGLPYDSDAGRAAAAAVTCLMHLTAMRTSQEMAAVIGAFPRYAANREHCVRVMRNHLAFALRVGGCDGEDERTRYDGIVPPPDVDRHGVPACLRKPLAAAAGGCDPAAPLRNAQLTLLAPTGTIGLLLGCDTTGVEPDFALVKTKQLVGGGYMQLVNQAVVPALKAMGLGHATVDAVAAHVYGTRRVPDAALALLRRHDPGVNDAAVNAGLAAHGDLERAVREAVPAAEWNRLFPARPGGGWREYAAFRPLASLLLLSNPDTAVADAVALADGWQAEAGGHGTVDDCPHLTADQKAVFDCATAGRPGGRSLTPAAHIDMMAAVQPALSGAISKTVNLPADAAPADVHAALWRGWEKRLKCVAVYVDGQKLSQPLVAGDGRTAAGVVAAPAAPPDPAPPAFDAAALDDDVYGTADLFAADPARPPGRRPLPARRRGVTQKFRLGGQTFYLRTGEYPDGTLGEIFLDVSMEGSAFRALGNAMAVAVSLGLQHGVPLEEYVEAFVGMRFEPAGVLQGHDRVKMATSFLDAIFKDLAIHYLGRDELAHVQPADPPAARLRVLPADPQTVAKAGPPAAPPEAAEWEVWDGEADAPPVPVPPPPRPARGGGGGLCPQCQNFTLRRTGTCQTCETCFYNSGCS